MIYQHVYCKSVSLYLVGGTINKDNLFYSELTNIVKISDLLWSIYLHWNNW